MATSIFSMCFFVANSYAQTNYHTYLSVKFLTTNASSPDTIQGYQLSNINNQDPSNFTKCIMPSGSDYFTTEMDFPRSNDPICQKTYDGTSILYYIPIDVYVLRGSTLKSAQREYLCRIDGRTANIDPTKSYTLNLNQGNKAMEQPCDLTVSQ